jgi:hypothetical protein
MFFSSLNAGIAIPTLNLSGQITLRKPDGLLLPINEELKLRTTICYAPLLTKFLCSSRVAVVVIVPSSSPLSK